MTSFTLLLVLASAVIHASWNLWIKQVGHAARASTLLWALTAISAVVYAPVAIPLLLRGAWRPEPEALLWVAGNGVIHVGYFFFLIRGYRVGDLSLVYPVARGTGPMLAAASAIVVFGERLTVQSIAGVLLIAIGILVLTWRPAATDGQRRLVAFRYGLATGGMIAIYTLWDGWAVKRVGIPPLLFYWGGEVARLLLLTPLVLRDRAGLASLLREHPARVLGIAGLSPLSYILILIAMRDGAVSHIAPARELSILIGAFLGGHVLGEGERKRRLVAAAAFAAGVLSLALA